MTVFFFGKTVGVIVEINIVVFCFGTCSAYIKAVSDMMGAFVAIPPLDSLHLINSNTCRCVPDKRSKRRSLSKRSPRTRFLIRRAATSFEVRCGPHRKKSV